MASIKAFLGTGYLSFAVAIKRDLFAGLFAVVLGHFGLRHVSDRTPVAVDGVLLVLHVRSQRKFLRELLETDRTAKILHWG